MERRIQLKDFASTGHPYEVAKLILVAIHTPQKKAKKSESGHHVAVKIVGEEIHIDVKERGVETKTFFYTVPIDEGRKKAEKILRTLQKINSKKEKFVPPISKSR